MNLADKKVTILGAGRSGLATAQLILHFKGHPQISELNEIPQESKEDLLRWATDQEVPIECGGHTREFMEDSNLVIVSPGIRHDALPIQWAMNKNIPVFGEIELASRYCPIPIIAVTGSNGKTTVVNLIAEVLKKAGKKVSLCGNVGIPFTKEVLDLNGKDFVVLEVSSFQLETIVQFKPHVAVFLNFSQNHLDRHKDLQEYFDMKKRIFLNQDKDDYAVLNAQDPLIRNLSQKIPSQVRYFDEEENCENSNFAATRVVARILGVSDKVSDEVFSQFEGIEHRLEEVCTSQGVRFINDSKSTTVESGRWALEQIAQPIVLICGGRDKNLDFSVLRDLIQLKVKKILVIGEARMKIKEALAGFSDISLCDDLASAVERSQQVAEAGDIVLFSPMCASFDMFQHFEERGRSFKDIVWNLNMDSCSVTKA